MPVTIHQPPAHDPACTQRGLHWHCRCGAPTTVWIGSGGPLCTPCQKAHYKVHNAKVLARASAVEAARKASRAARATLATQE